MRVFRSVQLWFATVALAALPLAAKAQTLTETADPPSTIGGTSPAQASPFYVRPTEKMRLYNYFFDILGPYRIVGTAAVAGINQADNTPPEWKQGAADYGKRFASDFGIAAISTTTRYGLARALGQDTLYYACECKGVFPRFRHAVLSTFEARRGDDGHRVFSFPALIGPYAGTMTAVYGWYPDRYNYKDGFRMGNYSLLAYIGGNVAREFLFNGPHSLMARLHLNNGRGSPSPESNP